MALQHHSDMTEIRSIIKQNTDGLGTLTQIVRKLGLEMEAMRHDIRDTLGGHVQFSERVTKVEARVDQHGDDIAILKLAAKR
jgi:hypothetical protein